MRAFRVLRLFGRLRSLREIFNALTAAIVPVISAFLIIYIVASICMKILVYLPDDGTDGYNSGIYAVIRGRGG